MICYERMGEPQKGTRGGRKKKHQKTSLSRHDQARKFGKGGRPCGVLGRTHAISKSIRPTSLGLQNRGGRERAAIRKKRDFLRILLLELSPSWDKVHTNSVDSEFRTPRETKTKGTVGAF